jgi:hypothetical protein
MTFEEYQQSKFNTPPGDFHWNPQGFNRSDGSDISAHLPLLKYFASLCDTVAELGSRNAFSTTAFISGARERVISLDIQRTEDTDILEEMQKVYELPCIWEFRQQNTIDPTNKIEEVDFLFVDSLHTFHQVQQELFIHGNQAKRFLGFHDWYSQRIKSIDIQGEEGIGRAIEEFMKTNPLWSPVYESFFNHGMLILEKR